MEKEIHRADSRGEADHGWLHSWHSFSFASYQNPERMGFGLLRVINDDIVKPAQGFATHSHENMEIVSIPLKGALRHKDSMGNEHIIRDGEVQIMSAGSGIQHSEYNHSDSEDVNFLQIWVLPKQKNIEPRYDQKAFDPGTRKNQFQTVVSPEQGSDAIWINQDAYFVLGDFEAGKEVSYKFHQPRHGIYIFVIEGEIETAGERLSKRDAIAVTNVESLDIQARQNTSLLLIEVPMH